MIVYISGGFDLNELF